MNLSIARFNLETFTRDNYMSLSIQKCSSIFLNMKVHIRLKIKFPLNTNLKK